ncbi:MAG: hypothetical protein JKX72_04390 [Robiginitomaculum sp.]|nr:hypothetical protein [Robiginitomaculum sp.]
MSIRLKTALKYSPILALALLTIGCGGRTVTPPTTTSPPPPPVSSGPTYTQGVFNASSTFQAKCAVVRTGIDPATNTAFADRAGSILEENHWLRSWSDELYLWYTEIPDQNPAGFTTTNSYFNVLKTNATTATGTPRDQFHFSINSADYQQQVSSGTSSGYGADLAILSSSVPRDIRIAYTEAGSPAALAPASLARGAKILEIDDVDAINGGSQADVDVLNAGLFPSASGETHKFKVQDLGGAIRTFNIISATVTTHPVNLAKTIDIAGGKVGYLHFTTFGTTSAEQELITAFTNFSNQGVTDLVLDLRYNGGGFLAIAGQLGYMIAGAANSQNRVFDNIVFNNKHTVTNPVTGNPLQPTPFYNTSLGFSVASGQALPSLNLNRVFILSTSGTCSASEAVINGLRGVDVEVILVGSTTCGKPYGFFPTDNCGTTYFSIQFRGENDKGFGDYADGFTPANTVPAAGEAIPGCAVSDDFTKLLGDETEAQFATALSYMANGICPVVPKPENTFS